MSEIKYTNDGKKVVIIGKLNSQETIVQEIYVVNGREIPSGEHFVVKSLHDQPCESWKSYEQKTREYLEKKFKKENEQFDNEIKQLNREHRKLCNVMRKKTKFMKSVVEKFNNSTLNSVLDFLSGKIKYIVKSDYGRFEILGLNAR